MVVRLMHGRTDRVTYEEVKRKGVWLISFPFSFSSSFLTSSYVPLSLVTGDGSGSYKVRMGVSRAGEDIKEPT